MANTFPTSISLKRSVVGAWVVYKAQDTKLDRFVALKFLPSHLSTGEEEKHRFIHEAKSASALDHPNICTIHEIDESEDGQIFIAMAFYKGETLKKKIERGPLPIDEAINIAMQIAQGLSKAHENEIVHRDIKPANIMITADGLVKIVDFGLAKLMGHTQLTKTGMTMGTVAYMSPEQSQGVAVDHRTDIWSLASVIYEMLAGEQPFKGEYEQAVVYSILNEEPVPCSEFRSHIPQALETIITRSLSKDPFRRFQNMSELLGELRVVQQDIAELRIVSRGDKRRRSGAFNMLSVVIGILLSTTLAYFFWFSPEGDIGPQRKMLVVLPFENLGPENDDYFVAGMTDAITARIARISEIGVISRQSAIQYKNREKTTKQIGLELGVNYILEGTLQRELPGDSYSRVRVIPQLIRVSDDTHLWADIYDEEMTEVFRLQSDIAERVAKELDAILVSPVHGRLIEKPTENLEAYDFYLRGNDYANRDLVEKDAKIAVEMYEKAVELDSSFALAWCALARSRIFLYWQYRYTEMLSKAKEAVDMARLFAPHAVETQMMLGYFYYYGYRDYEKALMLLAESQEIDPNNADAIEAMGWIQVRQGKWQQAVANLERAQKLNPLEYDLNAETGQIFTLMRQFKRAEYYLERAISIAPDFPIAYGMKFTLYLNWYGDTVRAKQVLQSGAGKIDRAAFQFHRWYLHMINHNYEQALHSLVDSSAYLSRALTYQRMNQPQLARKYYDAARVLFESKIEEMPHTVFEISKLANLKSSLGIALAGLGRKAEAIRCGETAAELLPVKKDARDGPGYSLKLVRIYTLVGEYDLAIDLIEYLLSIPSTVSVNSLRLDPRLQTLCERSRFQRLLKEY